TVRTSNRPAARAWAETGGTAAVVDAVLVGGRLTLVDVRAGVSLVTGSEPITEGLSAETELGGDGWATGARPAPQPAQASASTAISRRFTWPAANGRNSRRYPPSAGTQLRRPAPGRRPAASRPSPGRA